MIEVFKMEIKMMRATKYRFLMIMAWAFVSLIEWSPGVQAATQTYNFVAKDGYIGAADGGQIYMWGFADAASGAFRYPGPTIDVNVGDTVVVNLTNNLQDPDGPGGPQEADPVSMVFFGQDNVTNQTPVYEVVGERATLRSFAAEALPGGPAVTYQFTATRPGTYYYQSGTHPHKQIDMGLFGGLIIRPGTPGRAYETPDSAYDREYLFLLSAIDSDNHKRVEQGLPYESSAYLPYYWFINGRAFPDTILPDNVEDLPAQPMSSMVDVLPGEKVLFRMVVLDRDPHPFHQHGNHNSLIAKDGTLLQSSPGAGVADLAVLRFSNDIWAGETQDAIYGWTGEDLGWDIYGHQAGEALKPNESHLGHGDPLPVVVPPESNDPNESLVFGEFYSGKPFLGQKGELPVGQTTFNSELGEHYMIFHSHHEYELQNFDEGPGGMITLIRIGPR